MLACQGLRCAKLDCRLGQKCKGQSATKSTLLFNESTQINTNTTSTSGGERLVVVVAIFLGMDPGGILSQRRIDTTDNLAPSFDLNREKPEVDANKYVQCWVSSHQ